MPSAYLLSGIPAALCYAYYYKNYCGQLPEIYGGEGPFLDLLRAKCPILKEQYRPPPLLHDSRLMTIVASFGRHRGLAYPYMRELFTSSDGGEIALDWWDARSKPKSPSQVPVVTSSYIRDSFNYCYNSLPSFRFLQRTIPSSEPSSEPESGSEEPADRLKRQQGHAAISRNVPDTGSSPSSIPEIASLPANPSVLPLFTFHDSLLCEEKVPSEANSASRTPGLSETVAVNTIPEPTGIVLLLPGLTGDSGQNYILGIVQVVEELGFTAVVMNYRGVTGNLKTPKCYSAGDTSDIGEVVQLIRSRYPLVPIMAAGISIGGMLVSNYVVRCGRDGIESHLIGGMAVSAPWDMAKSTAALEEPLNSFLFNQRLASSLCRMVDRHASVLQSVIDLGSLKKVRTIREFDDSFTSKMYGFSGVEEYYKNASSYDKVHHIKTPLLALNAADDMFSPYEAIPREEAAKNPNLCIVITSHGGHIGFLEQRSPFGRNYVERLFEQYAKALFGVQQG